MGSQSRSTLGDVVERLQVRQLHHREERLLERILDRLPLGQQRVEVLLDLLRYRQRLVYRARAGHVDAAQPTAARGIGQQVVGQQRVQVRSDVRRVGEGGGRT